MRPLATSLSILLISIFLSCSDSKKQDTDWISQSVKVASVQLMSLAETCKEAQKLPRSIKNNQLRLEDSYEWTSGFFPGSLWYQYELTGNTYFKEQAEYYTSLLHEVQTYKGSHDLGFMMYCSYGNQYRLTRNDSIPAVLINTAENLISRYNDNIKAIRSWDFGPWNYPVIIDNMMNLELLFWASKYTHNPKYREVAIKHANTTLSHHFREDMSSYHVISYNNDGSIESKGTYQGYDNESSWARGQAWGFYGMVVAYRETKDEKYLEVAQQIAGLIMELPTMPEDKIPYWDYQAPNIPDAPRDVSAAMVTAAALLELSTMVKDGKPYFGYAECVLKNVSGKPYFAEENTNCGFLLKHSVGHLPANSEIDTPIVYADYYYLESIKRYLDIKGILYPLV